jgi:hypothetical protein
MRIYTSASFISREFNEKNYNSEHWAFATIELRPGMRV